MIQAEKRGGIDESLEDAARLKRWWEKLLFVIWSAFVCFYESSVHLPSAI